MGKTVAKISKEAMDRLCVYPWPGNVRELENAIERAVALESTPAILAERLPDTLQVATAAQPAFRIEAGFSLDRYLREQETQFLHRAMAQAAGDRTEAARLLGISTRSLRYLLSKHRQTAPE
jgi:two-component system response regulator PilR (NtrC family)